ncbi:MAG TPA: hypothetical protein ENH29_04885 [Bacteroidetes bacterium]|nr:hypothetical protein [Bacteroidota bacterium]
MNNFNFWQKWLLWFGVYLFFIGLFLAFFGKSGVMDFFLNDRIDPVFWPGRIPENAVAHRSWIYGVLGATLSGWSVFLIFVIHYPFRERQKWAWNCVAFSITVWFLLDTIVTLQYHVLFNLLFNVMLFLEMSVPLLFTRKYFYHV